jgi:hypothetical protein
MADIMINIQVEILRIMIVKVDILFILIKLKIITKQIFLTQININNSFNMMTTKRTKIF